jgi:Flp pilus assembly pilin Flp
LLDPRDKFEFVQKDIVMTSGLREILEGESGANAIDHGRGAAPVLAATISGVVAGDAQLSPTVTGASNGLK